MYAGRDPKDIYNPNDLFDRYSYVHDIPDMYDSELTYTTMTACDYSKIVIDPNYPEDGFLIFTVDYKTATYFYQVGCWQSEVKYFTKMANAFIQIREAEMAEFIKEHTIGITHWTQIPRHNLPVKYI